ncbi:hypothetical protein VSH64_25565 [Amycolatopsis rhabdoformis]|uniref:Uncharacterized protein n=1 Tax=Amycolatopsis rhabdoformis TaxID=1448059 RepID=A0ABZ1HXJ8_9PSEU|nr:hypothetical protein [Amycolatopsis rhabdoformis]WSE26246.1 hypothetical protein VSH64_25565 [Amycolatopsis rhabdoformis]
MIGLALAAQAVVTLGSGGTHLPALEIVVAVLGVVLAIASIAGLVSPRLRGR